MRDKGDLARPRDSKLVAGTSSTAGRACEHNAVNGRHLGRWEAGYGQPEEEGYERGRGSRCRKGSAHCWIPMAGHLTPWTALLWRVGDPRRNPQAKSDGSLPPLRFLQSPHDPLADRSRGQGQEIAERTAVVHGGPDTRLPIRRVEDHDIRSDRVDGHGNRTIDRLIGDILQPDRQLQGPIRGSLAQRLENHFHLLGYVCHRERRQGFGLPLLYPHGRGPDLPGAGPAIDPEHVKSSFGVRGQPEIVTMLQVTGHQKNGGVLGLSPDDIV